MLFADPIVAIESASLLAFGSTRTITPQLGSMNLRHARSTTNAKSSP